MKKHQNMHVYRFRILLEDVDDFFRDIEIEANNTFEEFHKSIIKAVGFEGKELASFYISDSKWNRKQEITLIDMSEGEDNENIPLLMNKCKLAEYIDDPHQRFIYIYDFLNMYKFYIELIKIIPFEKGAKYPRCIKQSGVIPKAGTYVSSQTSSIFEEEEIFVEDETSFENEGDTDILEFFSGSTAKEGLAEEMGGNIDNDKF